ncbi:MAG: hypothetical protein LBR38_06695 [Synergistaceae bacterium]|jgi:hypothetical protein|nr:hypothetical protein [Synergistaceae bacterium]
MINIPDEFELWLDGARAEIQEEKRRLGKEEYDRQMEERIQKAAEEFGFIRVPSAPTRPWKGRWGQP